MAASWAFSGQNNTLAQGPSAAAAAPAVHWTMPTVTSDGVVRVTADAVGQTTSGDYSIYRLKGNCRLTQGDFLLTSDELVLWIDRTFEPDNEKTAQVLLQASGRVRANWTGENALADKFWQHRLVTKFAASIQADRWVPFEGTPPMPWTDLPPPHASSVFADPTWVRPAAFDELQNRFDVETGYGGIAVEPDGTLLEPPAFPEAIEAVPADRTVEAFQGPAGSGLAPLPPPASTPAPGGTQAIPGLIPDSLGGPSITGSIDPEVGTTQPYATAPTPAPPRPGVQSFEFSGRGATPPEVQTIADPVRGETVMVINRGIRLRLNGATIPGAPPEFAFLNTVLLEADRAVIWTSDYQRLLAGNVEGVPVEIYLDGNVVFQAGDRKIYAQRMYYNAQAELGTILDAEILTPVPQYEGLLRLKADVVQQRSRQNFVAYDAAMTSSRLGLPRYWLQADEIELSDARDPNDPTIYQDLQRTGTTQMEATTRNNFLYLEGLPVFYWPYLNTNIDTPTFYLRSIKYRNDSIFGQQILADFDLHQLLGLDAPDGTDWRLSTDYLSQRGFALGTTYRYNVPRFFFEGPTAGFIDAWGLQDEGFDTLGSDRVNLVPETRNRGRILARHQQLLDRDTELRAELGLISDRNFLEQFFEREWDNEKDQTTTLRLRRYADNQAFDIWGQVRLNDFFLETEWLPRADHRWLGQPLLGDTLTLYSASHVGYARSRAASVPEDPQDAAKFQFLPWEADTQGIRAGTRQELDYPVQLGIMKVVPYLSGEAITYGEDLTGESTTRLTGQGGVRTTIPAIAAYDNVQSRIFNLNGLVHKVSFDSEFFYADSSENVERFPLYDPLDDNSQEHFRRRLVFNTFGGTLPPQFDSRNFAIRQGLQRYVTAFSKDVVDDMTQYRLSIDQRFQTKRGLPGRERIADLFEFDAGLILYPKAERDNFGESVGALNFDSRLHLGDRVTLLSDGYADVYEDGLKIFSIGSMYSRPGRLDVATGLTRLTGPIDSTVLHSRMNYRLNEKYIFTGASIVDLAEVGTVGQSFAVTRVGESFLMQVGGYYDPGRNNTTFNFQLEPRFFSVRGLGMAGGQMIPPAGLYGVE